VEFVELYLGVRWTITVLELTNFIHDLAVNDVLRLLLTWRSAFEERSIKDFKALRFKFGLLSYVDCSRRDYWTLDAECNLGELPPLALVAAERRHLLGAHQSTASESRALWHILGHTLLFLVFQYFF